MNLTLINKIEGNISDIISDDFSAIKSVEFGVFETNCNYILTDGFEGFLFNFKSIISSENLEQNTNYGLNFNNNKTFTDINISY